MRQMFGSYVTCDSWTYNLQYYLLLQYYRSHGFTVIIFCNITQGLCPCEIMQHNTTRIPNMENSSRQTFRETKLLQLTGQWFTVNIILCCTGENEAEHCHASFDISTLCKTDWGHKCTVHSINMLQVQQCYCHAKYTFLLWASTTCKTNLIVMLEYVVSKYIRVEIRLTKLCICCELCNLVILHEQKWSRSVMVKQG